jgi:hypothetical protein
MDKLRLFTSYVAMMLFIPMSVQADVEFSYGNNTFIKYNECLGVYAETKLNLQDDVLIFSLDQSPAHARVSNMIQFAKAKKGLEEIGVRKAVEDKQLWAKIGCASSFSGDTPEVVARVTPEPKDSTIGFAIRNLPAGAWISEGRGDSVPSSVKDNPFVRIVRNLVTDTCYVTDSLVRVRQFPVGHGRKITQLDIGRIKKFSPEKRKQIIEEELQQAEQEYYKWAWPKEKKRVLEELERKTYIKSIEICRFFLDGSRVLKSENISRSTGVDERVDTPTDLDADNWADTTDKAIGFISLNEGKDWDALIVDVGFEGILYSIQRLGDSTVQYSHNLYTYH